MLQEMSILGDEDISAYPFCICGYESVSHFESSDFIFYSQFKRNKNIFIDCGECFNEVYELVEVFRRQIASYFLKYCAWQTNDMQMFSFKKLFNQL